MRPSRRIVVAVAAIVISTVTLAACSSAPSSTESNSAGADNSQSGQSGSTSLVYWSMFTKDEPEAKVLGEIIKSFEADKGIKVDVQWQGRDVLQKVTTALTAGDVPDLTDQSDFLIRGLLAKNNATRNLDKLYATPLDGEAGKTLADVIPSKYDKFTTVDGHHVMVPLTVQPYVVWYDGARLPDVVSGPPGTWDDFTSLVSALKQKGDSPLALDADVSDYDRAWVATAITRATGAGGLEKAVADKSGAAWDAPEIKDAIGKLAALVADHDFIAGYNSSKWPAIQTDWAQGKADFLFLGGWVPNESKPYAREGMEYHSFNFPIFGKSGDASVPVALNAFTILDKAKHPDAAEAFISYLYSKDRVSKITSEANNLTPRTDVDAPPALTDMKNLIAKNDLMSVNDNVPALYPQFDTTVLQPESAKLMSGQIDANTFISDMKTQQAQYWKLNG